MILISPHLGSLLPVSRFPDAVLALALTGVAGLITGPLAGKAVPFFWMLLDWFLGGLGRRLDKRERRAKDLVVRGTALTFMGIGLTAAAAVGAQKLKMALPLGGVTEILLLSLILSGGAVWLTLLKLYGAMQDKKPKTGGRSPYYVIAQSTRTDLSGPDEYAVTRTGMGFAARSFDKGVVAPVFWYILGGLPLAYIYAGVAALSWRFGRDGFSKGFGRLPLYLEELMGVVPGFIAGVLMALAGLFTPTGGMTRAFRGLFSPKARAPYAEGGLALTAMAWSLNVSLGGPVTDLDGSSLPHRWIGPEGATARLERGHLRRGFYISLMAYLLFTALLMGAAVDLWRH